MIWLDNKSDRNMSASGVASPWSAIARLRCTGMNSIDAMKAVERTRELAITSQRAENGQVLVSVRQGVSLPRQ